MLDDSQIAAALGRLRTLSGLSQRVAARSIGVRLTVLRSWEARQSSPTRAQLTDALRVYGHDVEQVLTPRTGLRRPDEPGILRVGSTVIATAAIRADHDNGHEANRRIIAEYLAAIRHERRVDSLEAVELRAVDLGHLAAELDVSDGQLSDLLAEQLNLTPAGALFATRAVLVAALMSFAAITTLGNGWLQTASPSSTAGSAPSGSASATLLVGGPSHSSDALEAPPWAPPSTDLVPLTGQALPAMLSDSSGVEQVGFSTTGPIRMESLPELFSVEARSAVAAPALQRTPNDVASAPGTGTFTFSVHPRGGHTI